MILSDEKLCNTSNWFTSGNLFLLLKIGENKSVLNEKTICEMFDSFLYISIMFFFLFLFLADIEKRFKCSTCNRTYRHYSSLYNHRRYECGKEPQFECPHCSYRAKRKDALTNHVAVIHGLLHSNNSKLF